MKMPTKQTLWKMLWACSVFLPFLAVFGSIAILDMLAMLHSSDEEARVPVGNLQQACDLYHLDNKKFPASLHDLVSGGSKPYMSSIPKDPWGNDFGFRNPGTQNKGFVDIWSNGEDGQESTADDVGNWELGEPEPGNAAPR